ncbi:hypothetical protein FRUB_09352 [Fimbriiglobus ruber]|uniref:Uncharacterized protein n=2 Tax=Fimbriiglobus ruber TaxID=1908690 RepID=A0A225DHW5_9BACT|nr:hypothetical protein FRUB_09352 [Fimbriiglobus ruber]
MILPEAVARPVLKPVVRATPEPVETYRTRDDEDEERPQKRRADEDEVEEEEVEKKPRRRRKKKPSLFVKIAGGAFAFFIVVIVPAVKVVQIFVYTNRIAERDAEREGREAKAAAAKYAAANPVLSAASPGDLAAPLEQTTGVYGDVPGEQPIDPVGAPLRAPLRPRASHGVYQLSNPRLTQTAAGRIPTLQVDVTRLRPDTGERSFPSVYIREPGGQPMWVRGMLTPGGLIPDNVNQTTLEIQITVTGPNKSLANLEIYLAALDHKLPSHPIYKVSNSVMLGAASDTFRARNWTIKELDEYRTGPKK